MSKGGETCAHNGIDFEETSRTFVMHGAFSLKQNQLTKCSTHSAEVSILAHLMESNFMMKKNKLNQRKFTLSVT